MVKIIKYFLITVLISGCAMSVIAGDKPAIKIINPRNDTIWVGKIDIKIDIQNIKPSEIRSLEVFLNGMLIKELKRYPYTFKYNFGARPENSRLEVRARTIQNKKLKDFIQSYHMDDSHTVNVLQIVVPVVVTDSQGKYVKGLQKNDFVIYEDGKPQPLSYFYTSGKSNFHLVLLIDISASMKDKIDNVREGAEMLLREMMDKDDQATVVLFNHDVMDDGDFTSDTNELLNSLSIARPYGATALYDAIRFSVDLLYPNIGHNIIVLFSDGDDNSSAIDPYTLEKIVKRSNSVIYAIGKKSDAYELYHDLLKRIASSSGGKSCFFDEVRDIQKIYDDIREDIQAQYVLQYTPTSSQRRNRYNGGRDIKVKLSERARQRYGKCKIRTFN